MKKKPKIWHSISVTVTPEYLESVESAFNEMDSLGCETDLLSDPGNDFCTVTAYFSTQPELAAIRVELKKSAKLNGLSPDIDFFIRESAVEEQDWLAEWKKHWKPVDLGRFVIAAPWHQVDGPDKIVIRIDPNMAFGTGTHETTKLCMKAIDRLYEPNSSFLDVGTGTGILAIAAAKISAPAANIGAVDNDEEAVAIALTNAEINGVGGNISFSTGTLSNISGSFDFVCANLTVDVILPILSDLIVKTGSVLVLSGILAEQEQMVIQALPSGFNYDVCRDGEWVAVILHIS